MRSRYTAYTLGKEDYLLATWHPESRPQKLDLGAVPRPRWLGLQVVAHGQQDEAHATVEFVARYKVGGRAYRMHELSHFLRQGQRWFYVDGTQLD
jgi:SEC-C motif-containing protein